MSRYSHRTKTFSPIMALCLLTGLLVARPVWAQDEIFPEKPTRDITLHGEFDLVSSYIWRGVYEAGPSLQPGLVLSVGGFSVAAWGSVDFVASSYKEVDLMLAYEYKNFTFHLKDLYDEGSSSDRSVVTSRNYFHFGTDSPHRIEAGVVWKISEKVPITLSWYTILFGARDVDPQGKRCYSSYVEVAYPFSFRKFDLKTGVGAAPWKTAGAEGAKGFAVKNVFFNATKMWSISKLEGFRFGLFAHLSWCPLKEDVNCVGGLSFRM